MSNKAQIRKLFAQIFAETNNNLSLNDKLLNLYELVMVEPVKPQATVESQLSDKDVDDAFPLYVDGVQFRNGYRNMLIAFARASTKPFYSNPLLPDHVTDNPQSLINSNKCSRLGVVKALREKLGLGLKEAIEIVDNEKIMKALAHLPFTKLV